LIYGDGSLNEQMQPWEVYEEGKLSSQIEIIIQSGVEVLRSLHTNEDGVNEEISELSLLCGEDLSIVINTNYAVKGYDGPPGFNLKIGGFWQGDDGSICHPEPRFYYSFAAWNTNIIENGASTQKTLDANNDAIIEAASHLDGVKSFILFPTSDIEYWNGDKVSHANLIGNYRAPMKFKHNGVLITFPRILIPENDDEPQELIRSTAMSTSLGNTLNHTYITRESKAERLKQRQAYQ